MARFQRSTLPSVDYIKDLAARAAGGDNTALQELGERNRSISRMMNERMRKLEKAGETGDAYKRIVELNDNKTRFSTAKTGDAEHLYDNLMSAMKAAGYKESTLGGISEVSQQTTTSLFRHFGLLGEGEEASKAETQRMNEFFKSDYWKANRSLYDSDGLEDLAGPIKAGDDFNEIMSRIQTWDSKNPFAVLDDWLDF